MKNQISETQKGVLFALVAYLLWGISPLYWKLIVHLPLFEVFSHRVLWSAVTCFGVIFCLRKVPSFKSLKKSKPLPLLANTVFIAINWFVYLYSVDSSRILEASLGYFINPILNIFLGFLILKEKLGKLQWCAVFLALFAVLNEIISFGKLPWISLTLAFSFGLYGLVRKTSPWDSLVSLTLESSILALPILIFLGSLSLKGENHFFLSSSNTLLLIGGGILTALPLLFFGPATKRINYSTIGIIQYLAPTLHFLLAVFIYKEPFGMAKLFTFIPIWVALALYSYEGVKNEKNVS